MSQNTRAALFLLRLAELHADPAYADTTAPAPSAYIETAATTSLTAYRNAAATALTPFTDAHHNHGAFAAGYGLALARLLQHPAPVTPEAA